MTASAEALGSPESLKEPTRNSVPGTPSSSANWGPAPTAAEVDQSGSERHAGSRVSQLRARPQFWVL